MDKRMLKEILAAHADQLVKGKAASRNYLDLLPDQDDDLAPLLSVAERVESILKPVAPPNSFEQQLKQELLSIAHKHQAEGYIPPNPTRDLFVLFVTTTFILALSVVLLILRRQNFTSSWNMKQNPNHLQQPPLNYKTP